MNKRRLIISLWSSVIFVSLAGGLLASVAWFVSSNDLKVDVTGSVVEEYFHCGKGTVDDPFVITRPIHYYHLVEFFQRETTLPLSNSPHFGSDYLYFQVGYDLDDDGDLEVYSYDDQGIYQGTFASPVYSNTLNMAYYSGTNALMPIGTNEVPFIGSFDGKASDGISISNINIHCSETVLKGNQSITRTASDIGVFGYVADSVNSTATVIKNARFNGVNIDLTNVAATVASSTTGVQHVNAHDNNTAYVGYIAGHVHTYTNYVAGNPATNASPLYDVYVNNATVQGGPGTVCNYGYIGLVDTIDGEESADISGIVEELGQGPGGGQGQGDEWGGSFNSKEYNNWFYDLGTSGELFNTNLNRNGYSSNGYNQKTVTGSGGYAINFSTSDTSNPQTNHIVNRLREGSYLPLSFSDETKSHASMSNTGYLVGSNLSGVNASPKISSYKMVNIGNAISNTAYKDMSKTSSSSTANIPYDNSKLEILTYQGGWKRIKDTYNANNNSSNSQIRSYTKTDLSTFGFQKYETSRAVLGEILSEGTMIHGIHFDNNTVSATNLFTIPANTARVNGTAYTTTYQVPKGSINFSLKEKGLINFFAGTYNTSNIDLNFFSLNEVKRNGGNISSIKEITQIYVNTAESGGYVYKYSDNTYSTGTRGNLVFDVATVLKAAAPVVNMMYYFEIPVNAGEYAMGIASGATQGAYMIYLDIGASAGEEEEPTFNQENIISDSPLFTQIGFLSSTDSFFFNSCFNVAYVIPTGSDKDKFSITISCGTETVDGNPYTCYDIAIVNTSGNNFIISALLIDDDDIDDENYFYMYAITYNGGTRTTYHSSNTYTGASGATSMAPTYS